MSWNPFKRKEQPADEAVPGTPPADAAPVDDAEPTAGANDDTDPLVAVGTITEQTALLSDSRGVRLERVEVWGPSGLSDQFMRLLVGEPGRHADALRGLLLNASADVSGFRNLLARDDVALAATTDFPAQRLAAIAAEQTAPPELPRPVELLVGLHTLAEFLAQAQEKHGLYWADCDPEDISLITVERDLPQGLSRRQLGFCGWDHLTAEQSGEGPAGLIKALLPGFKRLRRAAATSGFIYGVRHLEAVITLLEELLGLPELTYQRVVEMADALRPRFALSGTSDVGRHRKHNEDAYILHSVDQASSTGVQFTMAAVADGMGGHASGELASSLALDLLRQQLAMALLSPRSKPVDPSRLAEQLDAIIPSIDRALTERAIMEPELGGMGTTLVGFAVLRQATTLGATGARVLGSESAVIFNVGDSRAYLLGPGGLRRLTKDHSQVQELVDKGAVTPEEAFRHPQKNIITRCLGGNAADSTPNILDFMPGPGEIVLLCSDGLTDVLRDEDIERVVRETATAERSELARALVRAANAEGGPDNITVVLIACGV